MQLFQASHQWATRPGDERFTSLTALNDYVQAARQQAKEKVLPSRALTVRPVKDDPKGLVVIGPNGGPVTTTNWSFRQLSSLVGARSSYLATLPSPLTADCLNYGLHHYREEKDIGVLLGRGEGSHELRAVTGPTYGRIWNAQITQPLVDRFGDGLTGDFRVPGEWGQRVEVTKKNTTLFASDRDMFVALADEEHRIEMKNRRDGKRGSLARGFMVGNSEVGLSTVWVALFLFDYFCGNRIIWGVQEYKEIRVRHTSKALQHFEQRVLPAFNTYAHSSTAGVEATIQAAQEAKVGNLQKFLAARFTRAQAEGIEAAHLKEEGRPIETLWDVTTAVTAYAKESPYNIERVQLERKGGQILQLATSSKLNALDVDFTEV